MNGASECEIATENSGVSREHDSSFGTELLSLTNQTININNETRVNLESGENKDIPKVGFNYDNVDFILRKIILFSIQNLKFFF